MVSKGDVEFYHGLAVMTAARAIANTDKEGWDKLSYRKRQNCLDAAVRVVQAYIDVDSALASLVVQYTSKPMSKK